MKFAYKQRGKITKDIRQLLDKVISIVEGYQQQGYEMTLRQLFYQLVTRLILPNEQRQYGKLSRILLDARMYGEIDWDFIVDRVRVPDKHAEWDGIPKIIETAIAVYRKKRWDNQPNYVEVWVEKDALSGVLKPITDEYHVLLMVNRGYSSATAMHDAALRFCAKQIEDKNCFIIYLGDHDPAGEDMVRDVRDRLAEMYANPTVEKLALTMDQIREYNPPPNPVKMTDSKAVGYVIEHGEYSWELDALPPNILSQLLRTRLEQLIDREKYDGVIATEELEKDKLVALAEQEFKQTF